MPEGSLGSNKIVEVGDKIKLIESNIDFINQQIETLKQRSSVVVIYNNFRERGIGISRADGSGTDALTRHSDVAVFLALQSEIISCRKSISTLQK